jgi:hypothetical protein
MNLTQEQRHERLQAAITAKVALGYIVASQTMTTAQLVKPRRFGFWDLVITLCTIGFWLLVYFARKTKMVFISVNEMGVVTEQ